MIVQLGLPLAPPDAPQTAEPARKAPTTSGPSPAPVPAPTVGASSHASTPPAVTPPVDVIQFVRRRGTRRYILRLLDDGTLRVTVPWWGSKREARAFVASQHAWIARQRGLRAQRTAARWGVGAEVLLDGDVHQLAADASGSVHLAGVRVGATTDDERVLKAAVQARLRARAAEHLPRELRTLAARHDITVTRVSVRNQASRWGSCSRQGAISLNWRLVQVPPFVREYVLLHELMHRREMNHSPRFWRHVAAACPAYVEARRWLRVEGARLFE